VTGLASPERNHTRVRALPGRETCSSAGTIAALLASNLTSPLSPTRSTTTTPPLGYSIDVDASVTPLHPPENSKADATEQHDPMRPTSSQSGAPLLQAAVVLGAGASAKRQSAPAEPQWCSRVKARRPTAKTRCSSLRRAIVVASFAASRLTTPSGTRWVTSGRTPDQATP